MRYHIPCSARLISKLKKMTILILQWALTAMYDRVPTKELAMESISCPLTPKSQILISPRELTNILEGLTSEIYDTLLC